jgi:hypothetical protein
MNAPVNVIEKPWGFEYLAYENDVVGVWILHIQKNQATSMHCHSRKTTGLLVLDGEIMLSFLGDQIQLNKLQKRMIRRGLFHSSASISEHGSILLEIETPKDKTDLIRLTDKYGREAQPYETKQIVKSDCVKFENSIFYRKNLYNFANCNFTIERLHDVQPIHEKNDTDILIFLRGGVYTDGNQPAIIPGDIGVASIVKRVCKSINNIPENTLLMTVTPMV